MFDGGISAKELVDQIQQETDVAVPIPNSTFYEWLNAIHFLLYTELIREIHWLVCTELPDGEIDIEHIAVSNESSVRVEDIYAVYADLSENTKIKPIQLTRMTSLNGGIFPYSYFKSGSKLKINIPLQPGQAVSQIKIAYYAKPDIITTDNAESVKVAVPREFISLVKAKLRGEAYKLMNEGNVAANWLSDYNVLLDTFQKWVDSRRETIGI